MGLQSETLGVKVKGHVCTVYLLIEVADAPPDQGKVHVVDVVGRVLGFRRMLNRLASVNWRSYNEHSLSNVKSNFISTLTPCETQTPAIKRLFRHGTKVGFNTFSFFKGNGHNW